MEKTDPGNKLSAFNAEPFVRPGLLGDIVTNTHLSVDESNRSPPKTLLEPQLVLSCPHVALGLGTRDVISSPTRVGVKFTCVSLACF